MQRPTLSPLPTALGRIGQDGALRPRSLPPLLQTGPPSCCRMQGPAVLIPFPFFFCCLVLQLWWVAPTDTACTARMQAHSGSVRVARLNIMEENSALCNACIERPGRPDAALPTMLLGCMELSVCVDSGFPLER